MMAAAARLAEASVGLAEHLARLETACFPPDEAASIDTILMRLTNAGPFFRILKGDGDDDVIGMVNGTCCAAGTITHESMFAHDSAGTTLVIHSICVAPSKRRQGLGLAMLKSYVLYITKEVPQVRHILLLSHAPLLQLYLAAGFLVVRQSPVIHGSEHWYELSLDVASARCPQQHVVDAFTFNFFGGNPAAVVFQDVWQPRAHDEEWMQKVAAENNLAETAFLLPVGEDAFSLRWFTPACEIALCGHATLASAFFLLSTGRAQPGRLISFKTVFSGTLTAVCGSDGEIELDFPSTPPLVVADGERVPLQALLLKALPGLEEADILYLGKTNQGDTFVELTPVRLFQLASETINMGAIDEIGGRGLVVTCVGAEPWDPRFSFVSRYFAPHVGVPEDPVTGSAHCALAPFFLEKLAGREGQSMLGYQASARGGEVGVTVVGDRVKLRGRCVTVSEGKLLCA